MRKVISSLGLIGFLGASSAAWGQVVNVDVTPEEQSYNAQTDARIRTWIHDGNHEATDDERQFITDHWRRASLLWRIRHLAEEAHDAATVARVDAMMLRADAALERQIEHVRMRAPVMQWAPGSVVVDQAPPPPQAEVQGNPPTPDQHWVPGYWHWAGNRYLWNAGRWAAPPAPNMVYEAPRWDNRGGHWVFSEGRWNAPPAAPNVVYEPPPMPQAQATVEVETAPPPPIVEFRPPAPPGNVWIPGYWHWNGQRHVWIGGRWSAPRQGFRWQPDHWVRSGRGYRLETGRWVR